MISILTKIMVIIMLAIIKQTPNKKSASAIPTNYTFTKKKKISSTTHAPLVNKWTIWCASKLLSWKSQGKFEFTVFYYVHYFYKKHVSYIKITINQFSLIKSELTMNQCKCNNFIILSNPFKEPQCDFTCVPHMIHFFHFIEVLPTIAS